MFKQITATILFITLTIFVSAQNTVQDYVNRFGNIAVTEMQRTGIPASIILAQGILTSSFGNSQLALQANNHFNLQCDDAWDGELFYKWERGEKIKRPSCFRVYSKPEESFLEFSNVISNNNQIASLMSYSDVNYKRWAKKLVELGFTKKSEDQMVRVIEQFMLIEFDEVQQTQVVQKDIKRTVYSINGLKAVVAKNSDTPLNIATELQMPYNKILKYNDLEEGETFVENQYIFIEAKRKRSRINEEFHVLRTGETLYDVAQLYGIKLKSLCKLNHVGYSDKIASGERIYLLEAAPVSPRLQGERPPVRPKDAILPPAKPKIITTEPIAKIEEVKEKEEVVVSTKPKKEVLPPAKPKSTTVEPIAKVEEAEIKRLPPAKPMKAKVEKEDSINGFAEAAKPKTDYVIPTPGHTNVETELDNHAAQPIMDSPAKPNLSKFNTGNKQKETIADILKPKENKPELPHSNAFGGKENTPTIGQAPSKPSFNDLIGSNVLGEEVDESAPFPQFSMDNEKPVVKVKRDGYHIVIKGETLYRISLNYSITVGQIRKWNNLTDNTIEVGQELKIRN